MQKFKRKIESIILRFLFPNLKENTTEVNRPSYDDYFFFIAHVISTRSIDAQTQVGAVMVNKKNQIIATGYNGYAKNMPDYLMPNTRPDKYDKILHAEVNMLANSYGNYSNQSDGLTVYTTIRPCYQCLSLMINAGVQNIFAVKKKVSQEVAKNSDLFKIAIYKNKINYREIIPNYSHIIERLSSNNVIQECTI